MNTEKKGEGKIGKALEEEILDTTLDLAVDYAEIAIDNILENEIIKELPVVKTLAGLIRGGLAIKERFFLKKLLVFLKEFHEAEIDDERLKKFKERFSSNDRFKEKVTENILVFIERFESSIKSKVLARLFKSYIDDKLDWQKFVNLSICLDNLHPIGFDVLDQLSREKHWVKSSPAGIDGEAFIIGAGLGIRTGTHFRILELGKELFEFGIKPIFYGKD